MNVIASIGKINDNVFGSSMDVIVTEQNGELKYVITRDYDADTQSWTDQTVCGSLVSLAKAILFFND